MAWEKWSPAIRITLLYIIFGGLWVIWSDWLLTLWISDMEVMRTAQTHKGWFFVLVTGVLLFFLIRSSLRQIEATRSDYTLRMQESERQLSTLMGNLPGMAFRCRNDKNWTMLFVSSGSDSLTGYSPQELVNTQLTSYARIIHPEDRRMVLNLVNKNLQSKQHYQLIYRIVTKAGLVKWVRENAVGVFDENDSLLYIEGLVIDITEQKETEARIIRNLEELERINDELDRFATSVSHDLRSPLLTIEGFISLVKQDLEDQNIAGAHRSLQRTMATIEKMHQLLEDLLKLARLGKVVNPFVKVDMNSLVSEVIEHLHGLLGCEDCNIRVEADLPRVYGDKSRLMIVLQNLIENAFKFRKPGHPMDVLIGAHNAGEHPVFFVRDNGVGIEPSHHEHIFGLFNKLDRDSDGSGVGLSLVDRIIRFHGGRVWVESKGMNQGATFFFSLPSKPPLTATDNT